MEMTDRRARLEPPNAHAGAGTGAATLSRNTTGPSGLNRGPECWGAIPCVDEASFIARGSQESPKNRADSIMADHPHTDSDFLGLPRAEATLWKPM